MNLASIYIGEWSEYFIMIASFLVALALGPILIPILKKLKFGQTVRDDGPQTHLQKTGTPTIGGLIFLIPITLFGLIGSLFYPDILPIVIATVGFGIIGAIDDFLKVLRKSKDGLSIKQKTMLVIGFSLAYALYIAFCTDITTSINIPFIGEINNSVFFVFFVVIYLYGTTNTVNFADGLDGLLGGLVVIIMLFVSFVSHKLFDNGEFVWVSSLIIGSVVGFLFYNLNPAKVFMGDTGSLALGGAIAAMLLFMKIPFMIFIVGAIFVIEGLSVVIQVASFKLTGKRVFKMAPIHHHFELCGWNEKKVVVVFWLFCSLTCVAGYLMIVL